MPVLPRNIISNVRSNHETVKHKIELKNLVKAYVSSMKGVMNKINSLPSNQVER